MEGNVVHVLDIKNMQVRFRCIDYFEIACNKEKEEDSQLCKLYLPVSDVSRLFTKFSGGTERIHKQLLISGGMPIPLPIQENSCHHIVSYI